MFLEMTKRERERERERERQALTSVDQCDQIGRFFGLWASFQSLWQQLICPNLPHSYAIFVKVLKSIILGNFYRHFAFFLVTLVLIIRYYGVVRISFFNAKRHKMNLGWKQGDQIVWVKSRLKIAKAVYTKSK